MIPIAAVLEVRSWATFTSLPPLNGKVEFVENEAELWCLSCAYGTTGVVIYGLLLPCAFVECILFDFPIEGIELL